MLQLFSLFEIHFDLSEFIELPVHFLMAICTSRFSGIFVIYNCIKHIEGRLFCVSSRVSCHLKILVSEVIHNVSSGRILGYCLCCYGLSKRGCIKMPDYLLTREVSRLMGLYCSDSKLLLSQS